MGKLHGMVAIVTGGASGIGAAMVSRFAAEGAKVVACDLNEPEGALGGDAVRFVRADVTDRSSLAEVFETAVDWGGGLDILCNNAGIAVPEGGIVDCPEEIFDRNIAVNLKAAWSGMQLAVPLMALRGGGTIVNTSSISGLLALPGQTGYGTAKAGLLHLTRVVAVEVAGLHIRVNALCPGGIVTPILYANPALPRTDAHAVRERLASGQPIPRAGETIDIANAALFLASPESSFVTGQTLVVDGGKSIEFDSQMGPMVARSLTARWAGPSRDLIV